MARRLKQLDAAEIAARREYAAEVTARDCEILCAMVRRRFRGSPEIDEHESEALAHWWREYANERAAGRESIAAKKIANHRAIGLLTPRKRIVRGVSRIVHPQRFARVDGSADNYIDAHNPVDASRRREFDEDAALLAKPPRTLSADAALVTVLRSVHAIVTGDFDGASLTPRLRQPRPQPAELDIDEQRRHASAPRPQRSPRRAYRPVVCTAQQLGAPVHRHVAQPVQRVRTIRGLRTVSKRFDALLVQALRDVHETATDVALWEM